LRCMDFTQRILLEALKICEGNFEKLASLVEHSSLSSQTFFDFDWNDDDDWKRQLHGLLAFNALQLGPITDELSYVYSHPVLETFKSEKEKEVAIAFMLRIARILSVNCYSMDWLAPNKIGEESSILESPHRMKIGSAILIFGSLFNHSCAPNIDRMIVENKFVFIVRRPIKEGEQLFICYG
jgi:SET domain